jgi:hypothetical protein
MIDDAFRRGIVQWQDKTIRFGRPTLKTKQAFKEELEVEALRGLQRKRHLMDPAEYAEAVRAVSRDFTARVYAWGRPEWSRCLQDDDWFKRMLWHVVVQEVIPEKVSLNPWITPDVWDKIWNDATYPPADGRPGGNLFDDEYVKLMQDPQAPPPGTDQAAA